MVYWGIFDPMNNRVKMMSQTWLLVYISKLN